MNKRDLPALLASTLLLVCALAVSGCASTQKRDWNDRIGHYTFDQAVQEMGSPISSATLDDGGLIAEWFLKPGPNLSLALGSGFATSQSAVSAGQGVAIPTKGHYLRLEFGPNHILQHWQKVRH